MSTRSFLKRHVSYANVAATTALLVAFGGGGAAVAASVGHNTVGSPQIKNGQVKTADLGNNSVTSAKVRNNSLTGADIRNNSLTGADVANDSLTGADVKESTLSKVPSAATADGATRALNILTAAVPAAGGLDPAGTNFGAVSATRLATGQYEVIYDRDVTACSYLVTVGQLSTVTPPTTFTTGVRRSTNPDGVFVTTRNSAGTFSDTPFFSTVVC